MDSCSLCGANLKGRWERLTPGIVRTLITFWTRVQELNRNDIHLQTDLDLDKNAYNNFQKLRYFGLVAKEGKPGHWLITRRGAKFVHGKQEVNASLRIFRNHIAERSPEMVTILDVLKVDQPYWPSNHSFYTEPDMADAVQDRLFI